MNEHLWHLGITLLMPAAVLSWRHSRLVSLAIAVTLIANLYVVVTGIDLPVNHPVRVLIPAISAALGYAEAYAEGRAGKVVFDRNPKIDFEISKKAVLGVLIFSMGVTDIAALFMFALRRSWIPPVFSIIVCLTIIAVSATPKGRFPWLTSSIS